MAKRTIEDFRAEKGLWRSELAEKLDIPEAALADMEKSNEVPDEIGEKIIKEFSLPEDYFTFDANAKALRYTPKKPFWYFFKVSLIWTIIFSLIAAVISVPLSFAAEISFDIEEVLNFISTTCQTVILAFSGVYLTSYINRKTSFTKDVRNYDYIYPYLPAAALNFMAPLSFIILKDAEFYAASAGIFLFKIATDVCSALLCAYLLYTIAVLKDKKQTVSFCILCGMAVISKTVNIIAVTVLNGGMASLGIAEAVTEVVLLLLVCASVIVLYKKMPKLKFLWLTVLPISAMLAPCVFDAVRAFS